MKRGILFIGVAIGVGVILSIEAPLREAYPQAVYYSNFSTKYPSSSLSNSGKCNVCHINPGGGGPGNSYYSQWSPSDRTFTSIESLDPDGDGFSNLTEINTGTFPGDAASKPNGAPTANAGPDQTKNAGELVTLSGTSSSDPDGNALTYSWSQISGPSATLSSATAVQPTFTPGASGVYVFQLVVNDGIVNSAADQVTITVNHAGPLWHVNDDYTASDSFTYAGGSDTSFGDGSASKPFRSVAKALQKAKSGDTIFVDAGVYADTAVAVSSTETAAARIDTDNLTLIGKDSNATVIDPPGPSTSPGLYGIYADSQVGLAIRNLGVRGAFAAIRWVNVDQSTISGDSLGSNGVGAYLSDGSGINILSENALIGNFEYGAILSTGSNQNVVRNNLFRSNTAAGLWISSSDSSVILQNDASGGDTGVRLSGSSSGNVITKNNLNGNAVSFALNEAGLAQTLVRNWWGTTDEAAIQAKLADTASTIRPYRLGAADTSTVADTTAPLASPNAKADTAAGQIKLTWSIPTTNEETNGGAVGYGGAKIYRLVNRPDTTNWANASNLVRVSPPTETTWTDTTASAGNIYYYRLTSVDAAAFVNQSFFTDTLSALLDTSVGPVNLTAPADGHETNAAVVGVQWAALADSSGIDSYVVEVSKSAVFAATIIVDTLADAKLWDTLPGLNNDTYYWRVRAIDQTGNQGAASAARGFLHDTDVDTVMLSSPTEGTLTADSTPTLAWNAVADSAGIDSYTVEISTSPLFASIAYADTVDGSVTAVTAAVLVSDTYYWRVRAVDVLGNVGAHEDTSGFRIDTSQVTVQLGLPNDKLETNTLTLKFSWTGVNAETYTWQLSKTSAFTTVVDSAVDTNVPQIVRDLPHEDTFYWRVIGRNSLGQMDTTAARGLLADSSVRPVTLTLPIDGHETENVMPVFGWAAQADSAGVDRYILELSKSPVFSSTLFADTVDAPRTSDTAPFLPEDTYYWRMRAVDRLGNIGAYSAERKLVVDTIYSGPKWHVNDTSAAGDLHTTAAGSDTAGEGTSTNPFRTIGKALSRMKAGDTLLIDAGFFNETVVIDLDSVSILGVDSAITVIDPPGDSSQAGLFGIFADTQRGILIQNLSVTGANEGIRWVNVDVSAIRGVRAASNGSHGIHLSGGSDTNLVAGSATHLNGVWGIFLNAVGNVSVVQNAADSNASMGIVLWGGSGHRVTGNAAHQNKGYGIYVSSSSNNIVGNNSVRDNGSGGVVLSDNASSNVVFQNEISGSDTGVWVVAPGGVNTIAKNNIAGNKVNNFYNPTGVPQTVTRNWWGTADESLIRAKFTDTTSVFSPYRLSPVDTVSGADTTAPAAPSNVSIDAGAPGKIVLTWTIPALQEESNGGAPGYAGAEIYRLVNKPDTTHWDNPALRVKTTSPTEATWTDTQVTAGSVYYYRLSSFDAAAFVNRSFFSDTRWAAADTPTGGVSQMILSGSHQLGGRGSALGKAFCVTLKDDTGNAVKGETVTFSIFHPSGSGAAMAKGTVVSDASGQACDTLTLGLARGPYHVAAKPASNSKLSSVFIAYADGLDIAANSFKMWAPNKTPSAGGVAAVVQDDLPQSTVVEWNQNAGVNAGLNDYVAPSSVWRGRGYWIYDPAGGALEIQGTAGFDTFTVFLNAGWHQIGSGQYFYVNWDSDVRFDSGSAKLTPAQAASAGLIQNAVYWHTGNGYLWGPDPATPALSSIHLKPSIGFFIFAKTSCTMTVFPNPTAPAETATQILQQAPAYPAAKYQEGGGDEEDWMIRFSAAAGGLTDVQNYVGVKPTPQAAQSDVYEPPRAAGNHVGLSVVGEDGLGRAASFTPPLTSAKLWKIRVSSSFDAPAMDGQVPNVTGMSDIRPPVTLTWENVSTLPSKFAAFLIGGPAGPVDLRAASSILAAPSQLTLAVGPPEQLAPFLSPALSADATFAYPNPGPDGGGMVYFKHNVTTGEVRISIYDVGGRLVRELAGNASPVVWDTTNRFGQKVGSGVYLYRISAAGDRRVDKLAIVR